MADRAAKESMRKILAHEDCGKTWAEIITREYKPLVDAARNFPDFGGDPRTAFGHQYREWLVTLRAALKEVCGA
jgi:hypothetical protein